MKVVHIFTRIDLGGAEIAALSALDQLNESIDFYIFSFGKVNYKLVKEQKIRFKERIFEVDFIRKPVQAARNFLKLIKLSPNIIIYSLWKSAFFALLLRPLLRSKFVSFFHNEKFFHFLDGCFNRLGHLIADDILVDSNKAKVFIQSLYLTRNSCPKVISFYLGVNTSPLLRGFSKPYKFVYTGRINVSKGLTQAIDFLKTLSDYGFDCTFTIYGSDNNFLKTLKSYISEKGLEHIVFIHEAVGRGDLLVILREFDFYLQLSPHEGMAVAVIDAMAVGLVPIVYPAGEIPAYSTHLRNSLHYDGSALRLQEIIACLKDHKLLEGIRSEAQNVRFIKQTYADSLLQALRVIGN